MADCPLPREIELPPDTVTTGLLVGTNSSRKEFELSGALPSPALLSQELLF